MSFVLHNIDWARVRIPFLLPSHYIPGGVIGKGQYGLVISARDSKDSTDVAVKKITGFPCRNWIGSIVFGDNSNETIRILREIKVFKHFADFPHPNLLNILALPCPLSYDDFSDVYISTKRMDFSLLSYKNHLRSQDLTLPIYDLKCILVQALRGVEYLHRAKIAHRDLKPDNILLNAVDLSTRIADFGLTHSNIDGRHYNTPGDYVVTLEYRSPELLLGSTRYDSSIDIWSMGVIILQLITGNLPFPGAPDPIAMLASISRYIPLPKEDDKFIAGFMNSAMESRFLALEHLEDKGIVSSAPQGFDALIDSSCIPAADKTMAKSLIRSMLRTNPADRISVTECIDHPFFNECREQYPDPRCPVPPELNLDLPAGFVKTVENVRSLIFEEIQEFNARIPAAAASSSAAAGPSASPTEEVLESGEELDDQHQYSASSSSFVSPPLSASVDADIQKLSISTPVHHEGPSTAAAEAAAEDLFRAEGALSKE